MNLPAEIDDLAALREQLIEQADRQNTDYPQYAGSFDGGEWQVAQISRDVENKFGLAFAAGDLVLARPAAGLELEEGFEFFAYSFRNKISTSVFAAQLELLT